MKTDFRGRCFANQTIRQYGWGSETRTPTLGFKGPLANHYKSIPNINQTQFLAPEAGLEPAIALVLRKCLNHLNYSGKEEIAVRVYGPPAGTRTQNPRLKRAVLLPVELPADMVRVKGLEPIRLSTREPKSRASTISPHPDMSVFFRISPTLFCGNRTTLNQTPQYY